MIEKKEEDLSIVSTVRQLVAKQKGYTHRFLDSRSQRRPDKVLKIDDGLDVAQRS